MMHSAPIFMMVRQCSDQAELAPFSQEYINITNKRFRDTVKIDGAGDSSYTGFAYLQCNLLSAFSIPRTNILRSQDNMLG
uniref:Uncharacterized protein n=1 Tax=Arundo donax TaxID=35708 RepID=A0A0A9UWE6_ARUDO